MRVVPDREMPVRPAGRRFDEIAVGEQHRHVGAVGFDARRVDRHHVRAVEEIGDAAEAFGLALRAIGAVGAIQPHQLGVGGRIDRGFDLELERALRRLRDGQAVGRRGIGVLRQRRAVDRRSTTSDKFVAVEPQAARRPTPPDWAAATAARARASRTDAARYRDRPCRSASRTDGNPGGGRGGLVQCAWILHWPCGFAASRTSHFNLRCLRGSGSACPITRLIEGHLRAQARAPDRRPSRARRARFSTDRPGNGN